MNETVDRLCLHAVHLEKIEGDVSTISNAVNGVAAKIDVVSSSVPSLNECVDDIRLVFDEKANETKAVKTFRDAFPGNDLEII